MAAAWRHRQMVGLYIDTDGKIDPAQFPVRSHAVVDNLGIIHTSDLEFGEMLHTIFAGWSGTELPAPLIQMITSGQTNASISGLDFGLTRGDQRHILTVNGQSKPTLLSPAELRTARLFASGATYKQVSQELGLSSYTVRNQVTSAYRKLEIHTKIELAEAIHASRDRADQPVR
jgi:DNA-binding CsgD family transcriptional regulator